MNIDMSDGFDRIATEYWEETDHGRAVLVASKCRQCDTLFLPKVFVCSRCGGMAFDRESLPDRGKLYSCTVIHAAPSGYPSPYGVGYVDFDGDVRVFGHVRLDADAGPSLDADVTIEAADLFSRPDGRKVRGYRFVPLEAEKIAR